MTSACGSLESANIGSVTGSATYDACDSDTISISANDVPSSTADKQYSVQREVCGDGEVIVNVLSVSGGLAGLELRASNAPGAIKVGLRTALGTSVQRFVRISTDGAQSSNNTTALGHKWLKLVRSGSSVSTYTSTNGSTWNFAATYTVSLPTCVQASLLVQSVNVNTTHTGVFKDLQFSGFTDPESDPTTVSFDQDTIGAEAGDTLSICLSITNPCICSPTGVDVQLEGSNTPHFVGYQPENLTFEAEDTTLCFLLPVSNVQVNGYYKFVIDPYTDDTLTVLITGTGGDPGPVGLCGVEPDIYSFPGLLNAPFVKATDRFGNYYPFEKLEVNSGCGCENGSGIFELSFQDVCLNRNYGFGDPIEGPARQEVVCRMFRDLSVLLNPDNELPQDLVKIEIRASEGEGVSEMDNNVIGVASSIYLTGFEEGVIDGLVAQIIQSGVNPYLGLEDLGLVQNTYHGYVRFNFEDITFHLNNTSWVSNPNGKIDLYTVALHEALHLLGFAPLIDPLSNDHYSRLANIGSPRCYSKYDTYLRTLNGSNLTSNGSAYYLKYPIADSPYEVEVATTPSFLGTPLCSSDVEFHGNSCQNQSLYRPDPWGSQGISHLNCDASASEGCPSLNGYVMNPCALDGLAQRHPHQNEVNLLCDLGYSISGQYGTEVFSGVDEWLLPYKQYTICSPLSCNGNAIGVNDVLSISIHSGETININAGAFLENDINNTDLFPSYIPNSFEILNINYHVGEVFDYGFGFTFHADDAYFGPVIIRYLPACYGQGSLPLPGQWAYITFFVMPPEGGLLCPENNNNCELICYGDFENVPPGGLAAMRNFRIYNTPSTDFPPYFPFNNGGPPLQSFQICEADLPNGGAIYPHENGPPNTKFAGFTTDRDNTEGVHLRLIEPLQDGQPYELSFYLLSGCEGYLNFHFSKEPACPATGNPLPSGVQIHPLIFGNALQVNCDNYVYERGQFVSVPFQDTDSDSDNIPNWKKYTFTFEADDNYEYVLVYKDLTFSSFIYILVDDISLKAVPRREVTISSENLGSFCPGGLSDIRYTICSGAPLEDVTLVADIPPFLSNYAGGGDFIDGETTVAELVPSGDQYCAQVVLSLLLAEGLQAGTEISVHLTLTNSCTNFNIPDAVIIVDYQTNAAFETTISAEDECMPIVHFTSLGAFNDDHLWTFGDPPLATSTEPNPSFNFGQPGTYEVTHQISNSCGSESLAETVVITGCSPSNTIGTTDQSILLTTVISNGDLPDDMADGEYVCIAGTLIINEHYNFINSTLLMLPGARIEIEDGVALSIVASQLFGCDEMWRGIEVKKGGILKIVDNSLISDAQYAIYVHPAENDNEPMAKLTIDGNAFVNNFVGFFVPQTPYAKINAVVINNKFSQTETLLKHPYSTQSSTPESLPAQENHALAGIIVNDLGAFSAYRNHFEKLAAGIIANRTFLVAVGNSFTKILPYEDEYLTFDGRGTGINSRSDGSTTTTPRSNIFSNCSRGIVSNLTKLTATGNTLTNVDWGILASFANVGGIVIESNNINNAKVVGILAAHANPNGTVSISKNEVSTNSETDGVGIWLLGNNAPAILEDNNPIRVKGAGIGIGLSVSNRTELKGNVIKLENADMARAGIALAYAQNNALRNNTVLGFDISGEANENIGLEIASSPGNSYCCNTLNNTRLGLSVFGGSLTTDQFRGTTFGEHATSLYLPDVNAVLGSQTHTENCWQGNSGAAVYDVSQLFAQDYPFVVDEMANLCFSPPSYSPEGWFQNLPNSNLEVVCNSEICKTTNFKPDSEDVKRLTDGDTTLLPAVRWELQRYLYEKLLTEAPGDTTNEKFRDNVENTTIGFFQTINENIAAMFGADSLSRAALTANLILASGKLDSLILIDSLIIIEEDSSEIAGLMQIRGGLTDVLFDLASDNETLAEEISDNFADAADGLRAVNDTITVFEDFEINEKVVNDLYLAYIAEADTTEIDTLEAIAAQCPLLGGNAVYRARALLAMMTGELALYNDSLTCASTMAFSMPQNHYAGYLRAFELTVFPNPVNGEVNIKWKTAPEKQGQIQVTDIYGRQVRQVIIAAGTVEIKIPADQLPDGMYFFRIRLDDLETTRKVIIQH